MPYPHVRQPGDFGSFTVSALRGIGRHLLIQREGNFFVGVVNALLLMLYAAVLIAVVWSAVGGPL